MLTKRRVKYSNPSSRTFDTNSVRSDFDLVASVLNEFGHEAGQYTALGPDPWRVLWNSDRSGFASFLEGRHTLLTWRSPVAKVNDHPELLELLLGYSHQLQKALFAIEVNQTSRDAGVKLGMTPIWTGTECVIDLPSWSTAGGRRQKVRWARSHAAKSGVEWREAHPRIGSADRDGIANLERIWKDERPERRTDSFLRTDFTDIQQFRRYFVAVAHGTIVATTTCSPVSNEGWYLHDIVRHPEAPRGALEGSMALALDTFRDEGFAFASNGPLPFWRPSESWSNPDQLGVFGNRVLKYFDHQYRFQGINQFRSKFEPDRTMPLYVLRWPKFITPGIGRSIIQLLNKRSI